MLILTEMLCGVEVLAAALIGSQASQRAAIRSRLHNRHVEPCGGRTVSAPRAYGWGACKSTSHLQHMIGRPGQLDTPYGSPALERL